MRNERKQRLLATVIGAGGAFPIAFALSMLWGGCPAVGPHPGPTPPTPVVKKGDHLIVMVDDSAPSIPQALVLDGPEARTLKAAGKLDICSITEEWAKRQGYTSVLEEAGGAPATLIITADGDRVHAGRLQTDRKAFATYCEKYLNGAPKFTPARRLALSPVINRGDDWSVTDNAAYGKYRLAATSSPSRMKAIPSYAANNPVFPESSWYETSRRDVFGEDTIFDQGQHGSCVGQSGTAAVEKVRALAGMPFVKLSPVFLYAQINGGRDQGAVISDIIEATKSKGVCRFDTMGQSPIYWTQIKDAAKQEALDYRAVDWYRCDHWEDLVSALLTGRYIPVFGAMVGNNFGHFDQYGVCGHDRGSGNHALHADGLKKLPDGRWAIDVPNSWGVSWGPWKNGRCYLDKNHLFNGSDQPDVCVLRIVMRHPGDKLPPPLRLKSADADYPIAP